MKRLFLAFTALYSSLLFADHTGTISHAQLPDALAKNSVLIDVRSTEEFAQGHIPGAINIPLAQIDRQNDQLMRLQTTPVVLYCHSGYRASKAAKLLHQMKFNDVKHLEGDMLGWRQADLPIEQTTP